MSPTKKSISSQWLLAVTLLTSVILTGACGSDDDSGMSESPNGNGALASSPFVSERKGTVTERDEAPQASEQARGAIVNSFNAFTLDTHRALAAGAPADNIVFSGYSLASALSLVAAGTDGASRSALENLLHLDGQPREQVDAAFNATDLDLASRANEDLILRTANRIFLRLGEALQTTYLDNATGNYGAPITEADFKENAPKVVEVINDWVSEQTNGLIDKLLDDIDPDTLIAVLNAVLLDATWQDVYNEAGDLDFNTLDGISIRTPFFTRTGSMRSLVENELTAVEMPYAGGDVTMLVVIPSDLNSFEQSLDPAELGRIADSLQSNEVILSAPEWRFEQTIDAKSLLEPLGLPTGVLDFGAMLVEDPGNLEITQIKQKAFIEVDKNGTRAAAATAVVVGVTSAPVDQDPLTITIDKPFWYAIRDRITGTLLFTGRVVDPTQ